jgi:hypothetical protein
VEETAVETPEVADEVADKEVGPAAEERITLPASQNKKACALH